MVYSQEKKKLTRNILQPAQTLGLLDKDFKPKYLNESMNNKLKKLEQCMNK